MKNTLKYYFWRLLILPLYWISLITPKNKNIWIFGEYRGQTYADNPKHLFEYINLNQPQIETIWLSQNKGVIDEIRSKGYRAHHIYSLQGVVSGMRAGVAICCVGLTDMWADIISHRTVAVNLWHGSPVKHIGSDLQSGILVQKKWNIVGKAFLSSLLQLIGWKAKPRQNVYFSASPEVSERFKTAFDLSDGEVVVTGYPRTDPEFVESKTLQQNLPRKVIFMPTFRKARGSAVDFFEPFKFDFLAVEKLLKDNNIELWVRLHRYNYPPSHIVEKIQKSDSIFFQEKSDIYEELNQYDLLITDLSSIFFDYLLLDKPIVFSAFDMDTYVKQDRELYYPYEEITPGPKGENWSDVLQHVIELLNDTSIYEEYRQQVKHRFNTFCDGNSSERVYTHLVKMMRKKRLY